MKKINNLLVVSLLTSLWLLLPTQSVVAQQYQFGYLSYQKALQNMPEYTTAQTALRTLKEKYNNEAQYNEEKFRKMFADFLAGQKNFPQEIMLKRQKELQIAMEQGISFRKDAEIMLSKAEDELMQPLLQRLDSTLAQIGRENGFIFILNTDNKDFPFIHTQAGKDLNELVIARLNGKALPTNEEKKETPAQPAEQAPAQSTPTQTETPVQSQAK